MDRKRGTPSSEITLTNYLLLPFKSVDIKSKILFSFSLSSLPTSPLQCNVIIPKKKREQRTYQEWVCSMVLPYVGKELDRGSPSNGMDGRGGGGVVREVIRKPCKELCERVEQRCPYFHPSHKEQYAGEPAFLCIGKSFTSSSSLYALHTIHIIMRACILALVYVMNPSPSIKH